MTIEPGRTLSADTTSFSNLNGLTIPTGPGTVALLSNIAGSGTVLEAVSDDPAPILGGNLSPDQYKIKNLSYGVSGVIIEQNGVGNPGLVVNNSAGNPVLTTSDESVIIKDNSWPTTDGAAKQILTTNGAGQLSWEYRNPFTKFYFHYGTYPRHFCIGFRHFRCGSRKRGKRSISPMLVEVAI